MWGCRGRDRMVGDYKKNYLCNQCLSPLMLWVRLPLRARSTTLYDFQWLATGQWFSPDPPVSSTNKTDPHNITEILLKEALTFYMLSQRFFIPASVFPHDCPWVSDVRIALIIMIGIPFKTFFQNENVQDIVLRTLFYY